MLQSFNVETITKTDKSEVPGYIVKVQRKEVKKEMTPLGEKESSIQESYFMKVKQPSVQVGQKVELDVDNYQIVKRPFTIPATDANGNPNVDAGKVIDLKWLQL